MRTQLLILFFVAAFSSFAHAAGRTVIMISLDGAKLEYFSKKETPHIYSIGQRGWAESMQPIFPSITFPNHAALATGCTAEQHGIVNNDFEDVKRGHFNMSPDASWMQCEPLWVTASKSNLKSAIALWPMSWTPWQGVRATYYFPANPKSEAEVKRTSAEARLNQIIAWLKLPEAERPQLILSWLGELDHQGHQHGPNSDEVRATAKKYDALIGKFLQQVKKLPAWKSTDVILVSDHGMSTTKNYISLDYLSEQLAKSKITPTAIDHSGPLTLIYLKPSEIARTEKILSQIGNESGEFKTYTQKTLPAEWHFQTPHSGQIILMARTDNVFTKRGKGESLLYVPKNDEERGNHGYPPELPSMQAIFFAEGPDFPHASAPAQMKTVDVAPMIRRILSLPSS